MGIHKLIKIGNSVGVTLPEFYLIDTNLKVGDQIGIEYNSEFKTFFIKPKRIMFTPFLTPEFYKWLKRLEKYENKTFNDILSI